MTADANRNSQHGSERRRQRLGARVVVVPLLLIACASLVGCSFSMLGQRNDVTRTGETETRRGQRPAAGKGVPDSFDEVRAQTALDPREPYWPYRMGLLYLERDSVAQAEAALKAALERDRFHAPSLSQLSKLYYGAGRHEEAIQMIEAVRSQPDGFADGFPQALVAGLALHYDALDRADLAQALVAGMTRSDRNATASALVYVKLRGQAPDSAAALASAALDRDARSAVNQNNYGITRLRAGDPDAARRAFLGAIELDPKLAGPYYNLAILEGFYRFDDAAAAKWFRLYRARSSEDPDSLGRLFAERERNPVSERK